MGGLHEPFAFIMDLTEQRSPLRVPIRDVRFAIGRSSDNHLCLANDKNVSRHHCVVHWRESGLHLEDCGSRNGTYLEGHLVTGVIPLSLPTWLMVGHTRLAVVPQLFDDEELDKLRDSTYRNPDSILIPSSSFFRKRTEAFLVVDLVGSSGLVERQGALPLTKITSALGQVLERALRAEPEPFLKSTGDGFFACFSRPAAALDAAVRLAPAVARHITPSPQISVALHWGEAYLTESRDRAGKHTHAVFSLEAVRHHDTVLEKAIQAGQIQTLILMTADFRSQLTPEQQSQARPLGSYRLKGVSEPIEVFRFGVS